VCITPRMLDDDAARWYAEQYGLTSQPAAPSSGTAELAAMPWSTPVGEGIELAFAVDTSLAVEQLEQLRRSQPAANLRECELEMVENEEYIQSRDGLIGAVDSSELLRQDESHMLWPLELDKAPNAKSMLFIDEITCVGCTFCTSVARNTFLMTSQVSSVDPANDYGTARVVQQGNDHPDVIKEAIATCPVDCIHYCTREELHLLEAHRALYMNELLAKFQGCSSLAGDSGGSLAAPHWRDPLIHKGWMKGDAYVKTSRLRMTDPMVRDREFYDPSRVVRTTTRAQAEGAGDGHGDESLDS